MKLDARNEAGDMMKGFLMKIVGTLVATALLSVMLTASASANGDAVKGKKVFRKCQACHSLEAGKKKMGPTLAGIIGRKAGSIEGYRYSKVFKSTDVVWDEAALTAYLKSPRKFMKGTKMAFGGLRKPEDIENLLAYLAEATK